MDVLLNPVLIIPLLIAFLIYGVLVIYYSNKNEKTAQNLEKIFVFFLLFCWTNVSLTPFMHWSPVYLITPPLNVVLGNFQLFIYVFIILVLASRINNFKKKVSHLFLLAFSNNPFIWLLIIMALVSAFWSVEPLVTLKAGMVLAGINIFSLYLVGQYNNWQDLFGFLRGNLTLIGFLSLFIRNTSNAETSGGEGGGLAGVLFAKNTLGNLMALNTASWYLQATYGSKHRWISWVITAISFSLVLAAKSGGALFVLLVLLSLSVLTQFLKKLRFRTAIIATMTFLALSIVMSFVIKDNLDKILGSVGKDATLSGRTGIWPDILEAVNKRLWFGYGPYGFWQKWRGPDNPAAAAIADYWSWQPPHSHQGFLDVAVDLGLIGFVLFVLSFLLGIIQAIWYLINTKGIDSVLPLLFLTYVYMSNLGESDFLKPDFGWVMYVLSIVKLSIDFTKKRRSIA